jgi:hypothetical protein
MSKVKATKVRKRRKKAASVPRNALKRVDLAIIGEHITNLVGNRAIEMVELTMDEVAKGHYLAMKYLFEMIGLCPATAPQAAHQEDSLAETLLRRLRIPEETEAGAEVTKEFVPGAVPREQESDAVE